MKLGWNVLVSTVVSVNATRNTIAITYNSDFSLRRHIQTGSDLHPAYYPVSTGQITVDVMRPDRETNRIIVYCRGP
jgi:hypothetical protein